MKREQIEIADLRQVSTPRLLQQSAEMVHQAFPHADGYPTLAAAMDEVQEMLEKDRICLVALDGTGQAVGLIGAIESYRGNAYELHPLVVRADCRRLGIGRQLVMALEEQVRAHGAMTVYLGTDDTDHGTNIYGRDAYPEPLALAARLQSVNDHPLAFYRRLGYVVVGIIPDANGFGRPDIFMAKRVGAVQADDCLAGADADIDRR